MGGNAKLDSDGNLVPSDKKRIWTLGGNQGNRVQIKREHRLLTGVRDGNGVKSPFLWPLQGESRCSISAVPTDQGHFCGINPA